MPRGSSFAGERGTQIATLKLLNDSLKARPDSMKTRTPTTSSRHSGKIPVLKQAATLMALMALVNFALPTRAQANESCSDLFVSSETRVHEQKYRNFVRPGNLPGRLSNTAAKAVMLGRLRKKLPPGEYDVLLNFMTPAKLFVSYDADGNVTVRLGGRESIQSNGRALRRGFWLAPNMSYGIDGRVQLLADNRIAVSTTIVRGDEKTLAGLERTDLAIELDLKSIGTPTMTLTETRTNWSIYRTENQSKTTQTRVEPRG
jgi:hypothetical protein